MSYQKKPTVDEETVDILLASHTGTGLKEGTRT